MTVLVWQAADKYGGPLAERWFKDPADGHKLVSWESYIWKSLSAAQEGGLETIRAVSSFADGAERTLCVRDRSTWTRLCSLDVLDQVLT